jgi:hypothetical protein
MRLHRARGAHVACGLWRAALPCGEARAHDAKRRGDRPRITPAAAAAAHARAPQLPELEHAAPDRERAAQLEPAAAQLERAAQESGIALGGARGVAASKITSERQPPMNSNRSRALCTLALVCAIGSLAYPATLPGVIMFFAALGLGIFSFFAASDY